MNKKHVLKSFFERLFNIRDLKIGPDNVKELWGMFLILLIPTIMVSMIIFRFGYERFQFLLEKVGF